jgi:tRNA A37 threonylcarbamoyladenosine dehydratase
LNDIFQRTELLIGEEGLKKLARAHVAIFGIGGVGGYVAEALARTGIGKFTLVDRDVISITNINRQIIATMKTIGQRKTEVMKERIGEINPAAEVIIKDCFFLPDTASDFDFTSYSYVVDAVDTVTAKIELVVQAKAVGVPIISSMGAGNKRNAGALEIIDLVNTSVCPLARVMRKELKKRGIKGLKVVASKEEPMVPLTKLADEAKRVVPGSLAFVPSVAGLLLAGEVVNDLLI